MAETRIDTPRSAEPRTGKASGQSMASAKSAGAGAGEQVPAFASLLATMDGLPQSGLPAADAQSDGAQLAQADQDALLAAQGHAPWMSLVGQTARLDTQGDADLRQGAATDFLSGRGNVTQLAHRQALQQGLPSAHAGLQAQDIQSNMPQAQSGQAQAATNFDAMVDAAVPLHAADDAVPLDAEQSAQMLKAEDSLTARAELAQQARAQGAEARGISLQGMTAVQPQALEGLKDLLRAARSPQAVDGGAVDKSGAAGGSHEALAAAVGAAMGAAGAGMQSGGQEAAGAEAGMDGQPAASAEREQEVSEQVAFWVHQKTQNAALTIQHEGKPIQVQVQLNGQEAHVRFAADDAQARQLLADGQAQLRDLLQAQGLNLAGVSVGGGDAGSQESGEQGADAPPAQARTARVAAQAVSASLDSVAGRSSSSQQGHRGVDLFV